MKKLNKLERVWISELAEHLRDLGNGNVMPKKLNDGLCLEVYCEFGLVAAELISYLFPHWQLYSGDGSFPVPFGKVGESQATAWETFQCPLIENWGDNPYADNRRDLCEFLADTIEELAK